MRRPSAPRRRRAASHCRLASTALVLSAGCAEAESADVVGLLLSVGNEQVISQAQVTLDSLERAGTERRVRLSRGESPVPAGAPLATTVEHAIRLAADGNVYAVVGPPSSTEALLVAPVLEEAGLAMIVPTATTRRLRASGPHVFPLAPDDSIEGEFIARFAADSFAARSATVFHVVDDYGRGVDESVAGALERAGIAVLDRVPIRVDQRCDEAGGNPYDLLLDASLRRGTPDVVIVAGRVVETACVAAAVARRRPGLPVIAGDGATPLATLRAAVAPVVAGSLFVVTHWSATGERASGFARGFEARHGRAPDPADALLYDAMVLAAHAVAQAGGDRREVISYLRALGRRTPAFEGVTGAISFAADRSRPLFMVRASDGVVVAEAGPR